MCGYQKVAKGCKNAATLCAVERTNQSALHHMICHWRWKWHILTPLADLLLVFIAVMPWWIISLLFFSALRDFNLSNNKFRELPKGESFWKHFAWSETAGTAFCWQVAWKIHKGQRPKTCRGFYILFLCIKIRLVKVNDWSSPSSPYLLIWKVFRCKEEWCFCYWNIIFCLEILKMFLY